MTKLTASSPFPQIRVGAVGSSPSGPAIHRLAQLIGQDQAGLGLVFASNTLDRSALAAEIGRQFGTMPVIGCTTAGEIGPQGYLEGGVSGVTFGPEDLQYEMGLLDDLCHFDSHRGQTFAYGLRQKLAARVTNFDPSRCFALLLIDGLCGREEQVARALYDGLGGIAMVGGSAGDGLDFQQTHVLFDGQFHDDAAILLVATTPHPFTTFKTQHFVPDQHRLVLTGAVPDKRIATEINGFPAAQEYARVIGIDCDLLNPLIFAAHPMLVKFGGAEFVRSIQKVNADGSLTFFCAINQGIVFNTARGVDFVANLQATFDDIRNRVGSPSLVLGCDCILRRLELVQKGIMDEVSAVLSQYPIAGFSTYGEQYRGIHINQTLTGIAIGGGEARP